MTTPSRSRSASGRDLGAGTRRTTLVSLLAALLLFAVVARDPYLAVLFGALLLLRRDGPLQRLFGLIHPTLAAGMLGVAILLLVAGGWIPGSLDDSDPAPPWHLGLPHAAMLLVVWKSHQSRLTARDHLALLGAGLFLVLMAAGGEDGVWLRPLLFLWVLVTVVALIRIHLGREVHRVLDLSRHRGGGRRDPPEVGGRMPSLPPSLRRAVALISFWLVCLALVLSWALPAMREALGGIWAGIGLMETLAEEPGEPARSEAGEGPPAFEIPPGTRGLPPFGARLTRAEFDARREMDGIALLERGGKGSRSLVRGECYDYLDGRGRWIRARRAAFKVFDSQDGEADGWTRAPFAVGEAGEEFAYLVPVGGDPTLYARPQVLGLRRPVLSVDGVGNLMVPNRRESVLDYSARSWFSVGMEGAGLLDPGPEFKLLPTTIVAEMLPPPPRGEGFPEGLDLDRIAALVRPVVAERADPLEKVSIVSAFLGRICLNLEEAPPVGGDQEPRAPPATVDVMNFLFERGWGDSLDFASAFAVLLRTLDIPCRLATGYRDGEWIEDAGFVVYRGVHVHAWVEIPVEGVGWVPVDPTPEPPEDLGEAEVREILDLPPEERAEVAATGAEETVEPSPPETIFGRIEGFFALLLGSRGWGRVLAWIVVLVGGTLLLLLLGFAGDRGRRLVLRTGQGVAAPCCAPFYDRLLRILSRHGLRRGRSQTPVEFARGVEGTMGPGLEDVGRLTNAFCSYRYGGAVLGEAKAGELLERVERIGRTLAQRPGRREVAGRGPSRRIGLLLLAVLLLAAPARGQAPDATGLVEALGSERRADRLRAREEIGKLGRSAVPDLVEALRGPAPAADERRIEQWIRRLDSYSFEVRERATAALQEIGLSAREALERAAAGGSAEVRARALEILRHFREHLEPEERKRAKAAVLRRREALDLLGRLGSGAEVEPIAEAALLWPGLRDAVVRALGAVSSREPGAVVALLTRADARTRLLAADALALGGGPEVRPHLLRLLDDPDRRIRARVRAALVTSEVVEWTDRARELSGEKMADQAGARIEDVLGWCPGYPEAGLLLVRLLDGKGEHGKARRVLEALALPSWQKDLIAAGLLRREESREAALSRLFEVRSRRPGYTGALLLSVEILLATAPPRVERAREQATLAVQEAPNLPEAWALLGRVHGEFLGDPARARECLLRALALAPGEGAYRMALRRYRDR